MLDVLRGRKWCLIAFLDISQIEQEKKRNYGRFSLLADKWECKIFLFLIFNKYLSYFARILKHSCWDTKVRRFHKRVIQALQATTLGPLH